MNRREALSVLAMAPLASGAAPGSSSHLVYAGTFTREESRGIYAFAFDGGTGKLEPLGLAAETTNPSFLAVDPGGRFLYSVVNAGDPGQVSAFSIDHRSGKLEFINTVSARGRGPCYVAVDSRGKRVVVANYGSGSVAAFAIRDDGSLTEASGFVQHAGSSIVPQRQNGPHAHSINLLPDGRHAVAADLGIDQVLLYRISPTGELAPAAMPFIKAKPGAGPRHSAVHPSVPVVYVIHELQSAITAYAWNGKRGELTEIQTVSTVPPSFSGTNSAADIHVHPSGRFLYGSNRGHDSIAAFRIDKSGRLTAAGHASTLGKTPRNFAIAPGGKYLIAANQASHDLFVFRIHPASGALEPTGDKATVHSPACVKFVARRA